jgi:hypothetical protein
MILAVMDISVSMNWMSYRGMLLKLGELQFKCRWVPDRPDTAQQLWI